MYMGCTWMFISRIRCDDSLARWLLDRAKTKNCRGKIVEKTWDVSERTEKFDIYLHHTYVCIVSCACDDPGSWSESWSKRRRAIFASWRNAVAICRILRKGEFRESIDSRDSPAALEEEEEEERVGKFWHRILCNIHETIKYPIEKKN